MNFRSRLEAAYLCARQDLLNERHAAGYWSGELSSSALSTATALTALTIHAQRNGSIDSARDMIHAGLAWLDQHANPDGGWGDTTRSLSNISTTTLCWAAFGVVPDADRKFRSTVERAASWLDRAAGGTDPARLSRAIIARYGNDRTFSVPILTMCALAGRLGPEPDCWRWVLPLPFELAALPHQFFAGIGLPVVSYALPALIAMGLARHVHSPSANPVVRAIRQIARARTLRVLSAIQPASGGFLEATPLTSFVVMSLAGSGWPHHPVTENGVEFLKRSMRPDGSWAIDTNLATWVTTLSVNALACAGDANLDREAASEIREWLLRQQFQAEHPYTHAAPGGWAWTDLPGGVPDADDTAGALIALRNLGSRDEKTKAAARLGVQWLLDLQNDDGGIPTFCRGWGKLEFDRSSPDLTAHAIRAWLAWKDEWPERRETIRYAVERAIAFLSRTQHASGCWIPLWFGNQFAPGDVNPAYGTAKVLLALAAFELRFWPKIEPMIQSGARWLIQHQREDGSWSGAPEGASSVEETALGVQALASVLPHLRHAPQYDETQQSLRRGALWLIDRVETGTWIEPSPIGFYFAKLWYWERLYPLIFTLGALGRLRALEMGDK
ncbi:MAG: prenyltransferase/squalene oxidase repeat-containing protein [Verrucomicrobiota bacterium]